MTLKDFNVYIYYFICGLFLILGFTLLETGPDQLTSSKAKLLVYWLVHISVALPIYVLTTQVFIKTDKKSLLKFALASIVASALFTTASIFLEVPFTGFDDSSPNFLLVFLNEYLHAGLESLLFWYFINVNFLITEFKFLGKPYEQIKQNSELKTQDLDVKKTSLRDKINRLNKGSLIAAKSEANYLRLYFESDTELILGNLKDLLSQFDEGIQAHRSFWVNTLFIDSKVYESKKPYLVLKNSLKIPIGRKYFKDLNQVIKSKDHL